MDIAKLTEEFLEDPDTGTGDIVLDTLGVQTLGGSLTNDLVVTSKNTVLKKFAEKPVLSYVQAAGRVPALRLERQDQQQRIENEENFRGFITDYDIDTPEILWTHEPYVEFELLNGDDLNDYIDDNPEEAEKYGREAAKFLNYVHGNDGAITDLRLNNFMMQDSGDLTFLDAEYFVNDAGNWEKEMDLITLENSLRQVRGRSYSSFRSGFDEEYGGQIGNRDEKIASLTSPGHAALLERDYDRFRNSILNLK